MDGPLAEFSTEQCHYFGELAVE